jgi:hypothetical protein
MRMMPYDSIRTTFNSSKRELPVHGLWIALELKIPVHH